MTQLDLDDMQGLIARGYPDLKAARYVLLQIDRPASACKWLGGLAEQVTPAPGRPADIALNVALTAAGLQKLGLPEGVLAGFSNEFTTGMITPHRRRMLGDVGPNAPETWLWGGPSTPSVDLLVLQFARDESTLEQLTATMADTLSGGGISELHRLDATINLDGREHFGFADGISQPTIAGLSSRMDIPANTIQPGEFILGYGNEYGLYTARPLLEASADPDHLLAADAEGSGKVDLARNGSYVVFRQLAQDVRGFWGFVDQATRQPDGSSDARERTRLAAKMVGRWPSGAPLTLTPDEDDPSLASANDFTYFYADQFGLNCPIGSHVRRSHPRDSLDPGPGSQSSVALDKRHRLLRRGREYGPPVADVLSEPPPAEADRGLFFVALAANIARQFEFIQHTWVNNPNFDGLYDEPDPVIANHAAMGCNFSVPAEPVRARYTNLPNFVTVRGGGYFFLPSIRALRYFARLIP